jgi:hypothetical protein
MASSILTRLIGANLDGVSSAEGLFKSERRANRDLLRERMSIRFSMWMTDIGHGRPGVPGGPCVAPGPSILESNARAEESSKRIADKRVMEHES